jgi:hypothetical protein
LRKAEGRGAGNAEGPLHNSYGFFIKTSSSKPEKEQQQNMQVPSYFLHFQVNLIPGSLPCYALFKLYCNSCTNELRGCHTTGCKKGKNPCFMHIELGKTS